jgi:hypothetical protein
VTTRTFTRPIYDYVAPAPVVTAPVYSRPYYDAGYRRPYYDDDAAYSRPLYDTVAAPMVQTDFAAPAIAAPVYRYVYQWDRILVIDPYTNIAIQAIPR